MNKTSFLILAGLLIAARLSALDFKQGVDVDYFTKLRLDFAARKDYAPDWTASDERQAIYQAFRNGDIDAAIKLGDAWLEKTPVDAEVYMIVGLGHRQKGEFKAYLQCLGRFYGLLQSITAGGDGLAPETAFKVIAVPEEYFLFRELGAKVLNQTLIGQCDKMELEDRDGKKFTLYFDVSISLDATARQLGGKPEAK
ncbi:MAG: DUF4919 domain-containing protein [Opitutaceae bacterium]